MEEIFGGLIEFEKEEDFNDFINKTNNRDDVISIIEKSIEYAYRKGTYTVQETYFIYKCLKKLKHYDK